MEQNRIITGVQPTGSIHFGNYRGAIRQVVDLQERGDLFLFVADLHALTGLSTGDPYDSDLFRRSCHDLVRAYIALGVDPERTVIYLQSAFPHITELAWIFTCLLKFNFLRIGHAYKDALQSDRDPGLGVFLYPVLMAADILLSGADTVPVGADQVQHIEIARELARKFNTAVGTAYFTEPKEQVLDSALVPGTDGEKMSKSRHNTLPVFGGEADIRKRISGIVTDSTPAGEPISPDSCLVCRYLRFILPSDEYAAISRRCLEGSVGYAELKQLLADSYLSYFKDARTVYDSLDDASVDRVLLSHRKTVDTLFTERLNEIKKLLGFLV